VLYFSQPISATIIAFIFAGEKLNFIEYLAIAFSMLGVVIMTYPGAVFWWMSDLQRGFDISQYPYYGWGVIIALTGSMTSGFAYLMMRFMGKEIQASINPLYFGLFSVWASIIAIVVHGDTLAQQIDLKAFCLLASMSFFGWLA
jgi:drug/metabolite transporter (DMT)-like permease